jgi:prevent-host-death family protein
MVRHRGGQWLRPTCGNMWSQMRIGIRELRESITATIRRVRAGETIEITHHGQPVAIIAPLPADRVGRLVAAGDVTPARALRKPLRRFPVTGELRASQAIEDDRAEG